MAQNHKSAAPAGPPAQPPDFDIDLGAALPPGPPPKRGRGRPRSAAPPPPRKYKVRKDKGIPKKPKPAPEPSQALYIDNTYISNIRGCSDIDNNREGGLSTVNDLKSKMTLKELKFIGLYFTGEHGTLKSMKLAGYEAAHDSYLFLLAKKIIERYETQAGDHRIIARALGAGEVLVFNSLLSLIKSKNERISLDATVNLAKILGLTKEQVEGAQGITIIFEGGDAQGQPAALALPTEQPTYQAPIKVLQITK